MTSYQTPPPAAAPPAAPAPAPAAPAAPAPGGAPAAPASGQDPILDDSSIGPDQMDAWTMAAMADARFSRVIQPGQEIPGIDQLNSDAAQATTPPVATQG